MSPVSMRFDFTNNDAHDSTQANFRIASPNFSSTYQINCMNGMLFLMWKPNWQDWNSLWIQIMILSNVVHVTGIHRQFI